MPHKPPYFSQTYPFSCVPTCLQIVLNGFGFEVRESELRELCKCDETGTTPSNAVLAAKQCGFENSVIAFLEIEQLQQEISRGLFPIVYLRLPSSETHAVVVIKISQNKVSILDPANEEQKFFGKNEFIEMWSAKNGLTILIE